MTNPELAALDLLGAATLCVTVAIACIALLRPIVRRHIGAGAVLRLWWILPLVPLVYLVPKTRTVTLVEAVVTAPMAASPILSATSPTHNAAPATVLDHWPLMILMLWLAGVVITLIHLSWRQWQFMHAIQWPRGRHGVLPAQASPAMVGVLRPRLALPADFQVRYSKAERRLIRLHESIHRVRRDGLANLCMAALLALQWFNPLVHWAARALCSDQESACDALVVARHPRMRRTYSLALLKALASAQTYLPIACRWKAHHPTIERISMLKSHSKTRVHGAWGAVMLSAGLFGASMLVYAAREETPIHLHVPTGPVAVSSVEESRKTLTPEVPDSLPPSVPVISLRHTDAPTKEMSPPNASTLDQAAKRPTPDTAGGTQHTQADPNQTGGTNRVPTPQNVDDQNLPYLVLVNTHYNHVDGSGTTPSARSTRTNTQLLIKDNESLTLGVTAPQAPAKRTWRIHAKREGEGLLIRTEIEDDDTRKVLVKGEVLTLPGETGSIHSSDDNQSVKISFTLSKRVTAGELAEMRKPVGRCDQPSKEPGGPPTCRFFDEKNNPHASPAAQRKPNLTVTVPPSAVTVRRIQN